MRIYITMVLDNLHRSSISNLKKNEADPISKNFSLISFDDLNQETIETFIQKQVTDQPKKEISLTLLFLGHSNGITHFGVDGDGAGYTPKELAEKLSKILTSQVKCIELLGCQTGFIQEGSSYAQIVANLLGQQCPNLQIQVKAFAVDSSILQHQRIKGAAIDIDQNGKINIWGWTENQDNEIQGIQTEINKLLAEVSHKKEKIYQLLGEKLAIFTDSDVSTWEDNLKNHFNLSLSSIWYSLQTFFSDHPELRNIEVFFNQLLEPHSKEIDVNLARLFLEKAAFLIEEFNLIDIKDDEKKLQFLNLVKNCAACREFLNEVLDEFIQASNKEVFLTALKNQYESEIEALKNEIKSSQIQIKKLTGQIDTLKEEVKIKKNACLDDLSIFRFTQSAEATFVLPNENPMQLSSPGLTTTLSSTSYVSIMQRLSSAPASSNQPSSSSALQTSNPETETDEWQADIQRNYAESVKKASSESAPSIPVEKVFLEDDLLPDSLSPSSSPATSPRSNGSH